MEVASPTRQARTNKARSKTIKLTQSQVAIAKKLGVPLEEYAKYVKSN
jgi:phage I-like protein